ncbi:potassium channel [Pseudoscourfieldia marina]
MSSSRDVTLADSGEGTLTWTRAGSKSSSSMSKVVPLPVSQETHSGDMSKHSSSKSSSKKYSKRSRKSKDRDEESMTHNGDGDNNKAQQPPSPVVKKTYSTTGGVQVVGPNFDDWQKRKSLSKSSTTSDVSLTEEEQAEEHAEQVAKAEQAAKQAAKRNVVRQSVRLVSAFLATTMICFVMAALVKSVESPLERNRMAQEQMLATKLREVVITRYFNLYGVVFHSSHFYDESSVHYKACRIDNDCKACFPLGEKVKPATIEQMHAYEVATGWFENVTLVEYNATVYQATLALFDQVYKDIPLYVDTDLQMLHYRNLTDHCTDAEFKAAPHRCYGMCRLVQPSSAQVSKCARYLESKANPLYFDRACLREPNPECPNCALLDKPIAGLTYREIEADDDPEYNRFVQAAAVYIGWKERVEAVVQDQNWSWYGSSFFCATLLTTIGYGNFAPTSDESRLIIVILGFPLLAFFGFALSLLSSICIDAVATAMVKAYESFRKIAGSSNAIEVRQSKVIAEWRRLVVENGWDPEFGQDFERVKPVLLQVMDFMGVTDKMIGGRDDFIEFAFEAFDRDGDRRLDELEGIALLGEVRRLVEADRVLLVERTKLYAGCFLGIGVFISGSVFFWISEKDWNYTEALYFTFITLTTIGLGDYTPKESNYPLWYLYVIIGLGTFAYALTSVTSLFEQSISESVKQKKSQKDETVQEDLFERFITMIMSFANVFSKQPTSLDEGGDSKTEESTTDQEKTKTLETRVMSFRVGHVPYRASASVSPVHNPPLRESPV